MSFKNEIADIREPELVTIFDKLNKEFFNDELPLPYALAWDYRPNRYGGQILCNKNGNVCYYIVIRGKQRNNPKFVEETMLHEMTHLSMSWRFYNTELRYFGYRRKDFVKDNSAAFMLEGARVATEYGCSFKDFQSWSSKDNPDEDTTLTSKTYSEIQSAKSLIATLDSED